MDSMSIESTVAAAVSLQQSNAAQDAQNVLLRKALNSQAETVAALMESLTPQLATSGVVGTRIHVTA